jgi:hypothetical protein
MICRRLGEEMGVINFGLRTIEKSLLLKVERTEGPSIHTKS